jgi:UDP-3-O-[3-hydroxymyristoyl] N-acetylglucosamine deacetylase
MKQKTIGREICFQGVGVHSGASSRVNLKPAQDNFGIVFSNKLFPDIKIELGKIIPEQAMHASVLKKSKFLISTTEHLMAAIVALGIDNLEIEIEGFEVPILDGSAIGFTQEILQMGLVDQNSEKTFLTPVQDLEFKDQDGRILIINPAKLCMPSKAYDNNFYFDYTADFNHPLLGQSAISGILSTDFFVKEIAPARTFGFLDQLPFLRRHGLAKGTSLGNTVVIGEEEFLNVPRFENEFVRHKLLDLIGDLALLGKNIAGTIKAQKTGHNFNRLIIQHYVENPTLWKLIK